MYCSLVLIPVHGCIPVLIIYIEKRNVIIDISQKYKPLYPGMYESYPLNCSCSSENILLLIFSYCIMRGWKKVLRNIDNIKFKKLEHWIHLKFIFYFDFDIDYFDLES